MPKVYDEKESAVRVIAHYSDFDGDLTKWKDSFYLLWRLQMTWGFAYSIEVNESRSRGVFVDLLIKPCYKDNLLGTMAEWGYENITTDSAYVGVVWAYEHDELDDIEALIIDS